MFFQLLVLGSNNLIWVEFSAVLFDKTQHLVKTFTAGYVPVCYEVINLFIKPQNFLLMFFICKLKGLWFDYLFLRWLVAVLPLFCLWAAVESVGTTYCSSCWLENNNSYIPSSLIYRSSFCESLGQLTVVPTVGTATNWCLCWIFSLVQWWLTTRLAALLYFNALQTSLARVQGFSLIVTT